jgi:hypothetical protein
LVDESNPLTLVAALVQRLHQAIEQVGGAFDFGTLDAELVRTYDSVLAKLVEQHDRERTTTRSGQEIRNNPEDQ